MKDLKVDESIGLVLEGGGMRGVFTCGVLDYLMDHNIRFPYTIGVSAGACNGLSYASRQRGRAKYSNIDLLEKYNYIGLKYLLKKRNILDFDLLFNEFPEHILPYDYETYFASSERFVMVTTNCVTGEANYFEEKKDKKASDRYRSCFQQSAFCLPYCLCRRYTDARRRNCRFHSPATGYCGWLHT